MGLDLSMHVPVRARTMASATLFVSVLAISAPVRTLCAQTPPIRPDSATLYNEAQRLSSRADTLLARGSVSDQQVAVDLLRQAAALYSKGGARRDVAATLNRIGSLYSQGGQPDSALAYYRQALPIRRAIGDRAGEARTLNNIGVVFDNIGRPDSALAYYRQVLPIRRAVGDRTGEAGTLHNIGIVFSGIGQPDSALAYNRQALLLAPAVGDRTVEARTLSSIGAVYYSIGQLDSALAYLRQALPIFHVLGDRAGETTTLHNIGGVFGEIGQPDSALAYLRPALPIFHVLGDRTKEANTLHNIGEVFHRIRQPDSALAYYRRALPIQRAVGDRTGEAWTLNTIGVVFADIGQPDSSLTYYHQALLIRRAVRDRTGEAATLNNIGVTFARTRQPDSALAYYRQALPISHAVGDRTGEASALGNLGRVYLHIGRLDSAIAYFDRSTALSVAISKHTGSDFNQLSYNETTTDTYTLWTLTWLGTARAGDSFATAHAAYGALAASERGRARALLDLLRDTTAHVAPGADFPAEGARLAAALQRSHSAGLVYVSTGDTLITWLIPSTGQVNVVRHAIARDTLAALVGQFRNGLGVETSSARLALRGAPLERGVDRGLGTGVEGAWRRRADELVAILLPPDVLRRLDVEKEVVIVPHGALALVPFAGLPVGSAGEPFGAKLAIRYAPSLATLEQVEARPGLPTGAARSASLRHALVVGNPLMPEVTVSSGSRDRLASLPGAEVESRTIATQLGAAALTGAAATETEVVRRLANAPVVHLATHGFAYSTEAKARSSFVALAPDSLNDGLLTVGKILDDSRLKLTADMVVLSACQTALGDLKQAEGTVGLQRAFLAKGARSVLVSLWSVSDAATQKLMTGFYEHWLRDPDHPSKAEALRRAQEEVRKTPGFEHPRFWAAFQLVGAR